MKKNQPISVFDSGLGGLTVVRAIREVLPNEKIVYFGDTARVPYGNKSADTVREYSLEIAKFLLSLSENPKLLVIACNTASAIALDTLKEQLLIPVIGVIEPGVAAAVNATVNGKIGVIGTISTINSEAYQSSLKKHSKISKISAHPCPLFVPLVEEGWIDNEVTKMVADQYLSPLKKEDIDTLILGCTHYPLLKPVIQESINLSTKLVDSAETVATAIAHLLSEKNLINDSIKNGQLDCYVSDFPTRFESLARRLFGDTISNVTKVHF
jgi:glutamate racemase